MKGIARTQIPATINNTPEFPTFEGIASFSEPVCNGKPRPGGASFLINATPAPGKYAFQQDAELYIVIARYPKSWLDVLIFNL